MIIGKCQLSQAKALEVVVRHVDLGLDARRPHIRVYGGICMHHSPNALVLGNTLAQLAWSLGQGVKKNKQRVVIRNLKPKVVVLRLAHLLEIVRVVGNESNLLQLRSGFGLTPARPENVTWLKHVSEGNFAHHVEIE